MRLIPVGFQSGFICLDFLFFATPETVFTIRGINTYVCRPLLPPTEN